MAAPFGQVIALQAFNAIKETISGYVWKRFCHIMFYGDFNFRLCLFYQTLSQFSHKLSNEIYSFKHRDGFSNIGNVYQHWGFMQFCTNLFQLNKYDSCTEIYFCKVQNLLWVKTVGRYISTQSQCTGPHQTTSLTSLERLDVIVM